MTKPRPLDQRRYAKLLTSILPRPITSDREHKEALGIASRLMEQEKLTGEETAVLTLLSILISDYERKRYADLFQKISPSEALSYLMEENHLTQRDFPEIPQSRISEILAGKRKISRAQAGVFGKRFKVSPALFL